jgi:hypothetical protein
MVLVITIQAKAAMLDFDHAGTYCIPDALGLKDANFGRKQQSK